MIDYINIDDLDFLQDDAGAWYYTHNGNPFTGRAIKKLPNGVIISDRQFLNGYFDGIQKEWYQNGQKKSEKNMKNNIQHGICQSWYENGMLSFEIEYDLGKTLWFIEYNESGNVIDSSGFPERKA